MPHAESPPEDFDDLAKELFLEPLACPKSVTHVTAVGRDTDGRLRTLLINEHSPKSDLDWFFLHMARARADAIVTTGKILRDEPELRYEIVQPAWGHALQRWRKERWQLNQPPTLVVLTNSGEFDRDHPALHGWPTPLVFTNDRAASRKLAGVGYTVISDDSPSLDRALKHARQHLSCKSLLIETGPSTVNPLYDSESIDELWLSEFTGPLAPKTIGPSFLSIEELRSRFKTHSASEQSDDSGVWKFHRFTR